MVVRVNGGIINDQTLTGGLRFFKLTGSFAGAVSDGTVNLPVTVSGGATSVTTYFMVPPGKGVPGSAAELVLQEISKQADIVIIGFVPDAGSATEMHIALSASALGWGSDVPPYSEPPADKDEINLPDTPTGAEQKMQEALQAMPDAEVYLSTGGTADPLLPPVTSTVSFAGVTVKEVSFSLGDLTYYTLR